MILKSKNVNFYSCQIIFLNDIEHLDFRIFEGLEVMVQLGLVLEDSEEITEVLSRYICRYLDIAREDFKMDYLLGSSYAQNVHYHILKEYITLHDLKDDREIDLIEYEPISTNVIKLIDDNVKDSVYLINPIV